MPRSQAQKSTLLFDAVLQPHRSLDAAGFFALMLTITIVSFTAGIVFLLQGAWPVFGFFGFEFLLIYFAFRLNYRSGKLVETIQLGNSELVVTRIQPSGQCRRWAFQPNWLQVRIDNPPQHHSQLTISSHGRVLAIGAFLTPNERLEVAVALREALARWRAPLDVESPLESGLGKGLAD